MSDNLTFSAQICDRSLTHTYSEWLEQTWKITQIDLSSIVAYLVTFTL